MRLKIKNCSLLCNQGTAPYNEDAAGITPFGVWVLDGATGLNGKNIVSDESDARWYSQWWNNFLHENIYRSDSLKEIMLDGIRSIKKEYKELVEGKDVKKLDLPSSSIAIVKFRDDMIEYFLLGDCSFFYNDGERKIIKDRSICHLDDKVYDEMIRIPNLDKLSFNEIKARVMNTIIDNRMKKNTKDGYWILDFSEEAIENSIHGYIQVEDEMKIMLASDGFTCASDRYGILKEDELIYIAEKMGIEYIFNQVREFEEDDYKAIKMPRFKVMDDSTAVYVELYNKKEK